MRCGAVRCVHDCFRAVSDATIICVYLSNVVVA